MTVSVGITLVNVYGPGIQSLFGTAVIPFQYWLYPLAYAVFILAMDEARKAIVRAYPNSFVAKAAW